MFIFDFNSWTGSFLLWSQIIDKNMDQNEKEQLNKKKPTPINTWLFNIYVYKLCAVQHGALNWLQLDTLWRLKHQFICICNIHVLYCLLMLKRVINVSDIVQILKSPLWISVVKTLTLRKVIKISYFVQTLTSC